MDCRSLYEEDRPRKVRPFHYTTDCTQADPRAVFRMRVFAKEIGYKSFAKKCEGLADFAAAMNCNTLEQLAEQPGIKFYRSAFQSRPCYYIKLDGVKYIWCLQENAE